MTTCMAFLALCAVALTVGIAGAQYGWQDAEGFHHGRPDGWS